MQNAGISARIKLDIDEKIDLVEFFKQRVKVLRTLEAKAICLFVAETNKGYHVILEVKSPYLKDERDIIFFQAVLGSDPVREALNWRRYHIMGDSINVLFNKKERYRPDMVKKLNELFEREQNLYT